MTTLAILKSMHTLDNKQFVAGLSESERRSRKAGQKIGSQARQMRGQFRSLTSGVLNLQSAIGVLAGGAGIGLLVRTQMRAIQTTQRLTGISGMQARAIEAMKIQARDYGVSQERVNDAVVDFSERLGEARTGTGEAVDGFHMLEQASGRQLDLTKNVNAVWKDFVAAMGEVSDKSTRAAIAAQVGGDALRDMLPVLSDGAEGFEDAANQVERFGLAFDSVDAAKVEQANKAIADMQASFEGVARQLTIDLAPFIAATADEITTMSQESIDFGRIFADVGSVTLRIIGALADGVHALQIAWKGVELIAVGVGAVFASVLEGVVEGMAQVIDTINEITNTAIRGFNKIPGVDVPLVPKLAESQFVQDMRTMGQVTRETVDMVRGELHDMMMEPLPSEGIDAFVKRVQARMANLQVPQRGGGADGGGGAGAGAGGGGSDADVAQAEMERQQRRLDAIREAQATEMELEVAHFEREQEFLQTAHESLFESEMERKQMLLELERSHEQRKFEIQAQGQGRLLQQHMQFLQQMEAAEQASGAAQVGIMSNAFAQITAAGAQHNREMFELNKAAGIANALVATYQGAAEALKMGPWGIALAGVVIAAGLAQVQAIRSQSFKGGGGAAPSTSAGGGVPAVQSVGGQGGGGQEQPVQQNVTIDIAGDDDRLISKRQLRQIMEGMQEELDDDASVGNIRIA